jgi:hypothetical protein
LATTLASLAINVTANSAQALKEVVNIKKGFSELRKSADSVALAFAGVSTSFAALATQQIKSVTEMKRFSDQLGISTQSLLELSSVFEKNTNIQADQFTDSLKELNVRLGEAAVTGKGPLVDAFAAMGLKIEDIRKLKTDEMILEIADAFQGLHDKQTLAFISEELFAGEAARMVPLLQKGSAKIQGLTQEYRSLNGVLTEVEAINMEQASKGLANLSGAANSLARELTLLLAGPGSEFMNWLTETVKKARMAGDVIEKGNITKKIEDINEQISKNIELVKRFEGRAPPGHTWSKIAENARAKIEELNKELAELREQSEQVLEYQGPSGGMVYDGMDDHVTTWRQGQQQELREAEARRKKLEDDAKAQEEKTRNRYGGDPEQMFAELNEANMTELELLNKHWEDKRALLDKFKEDDIGDEKTLNQIRLRELGKYLNEKKRLETEDAKNNLSDKKQFMNHVLQNSKAGHKILLAQQKFAALQEAYIESKKAVLSAYRWGNTVGGPVVGAAFAATAAAVSASMIAGIINPGGGSSGGGSAPVSDPVTEASAPGLEDLAANDEPERTKTITVAFEGEGELLPRSVLRELADELNSLDDSNVRISV